MKKITIKPDLEIVRLGSITARLTSGEIQCMPRAEYYRPEIIKKLIEEDCDRYGNFDLTDMAKAQKYPADGMCVKGRIKTLQYFLDETTERGAEPDLEIAFGKFMQMGKPFAFARKRTDVFETR